MSYLTLHRDCLPLTGRVGYSVEGPARLFRALHASPPNRRG